MRPSKNWLLTILFSSFGLFLFAQITPLQPIPSKELLWGDGIFISTYDSLIHKNWGYQILLHRGHRLATRFAGGAVFDLDSVPNRWIRLDSSSFFGYNNGALTFSDGQNLYKYSGYGFWTNHGLLLKFKNCQWEFEHQNREVIAFGANSSFYHPESNQIFSFLRPTTDQSYSNDQSEINYDVFVMNVGNKEWKYLGELRKELQTANFQIFLKTPKGFLVMLHSGTLVFLNVETGRIQYLNEIIQSKIIDLFRWKEKYQILQSTTGWVLFPISFSEKQNPIPILSFAEFEKNLIDGPKFYEKPLKIWIILVGIFLAAILSFFAYLHQKLCKEQHKKVYHDELPFPLNEIPFDQKETMLLSWMYGQRMKKSQVSVLEMNEILGIEGKSLDHQKKIRSEIIKSINSKYQASTGVVELIQRKPNPLDKRLVDYGLIFN